MSEPVAWIRQRDNTLALSDGGVFGDDWTPLYSAALAQPEQEPVAIHQWRFSGLVGQGWYDGYPHDDDRIYEARFLYTAPPQRKPLTQEEILSLFDSHNVYGSKWVEFVRAIEKAHGIGENK